MAITPTRIRVAFFIRKFYFDFEFGPDLLIKLSKFGVSFVQARELRT